MIATDYKIIDNLMSYKKRKEISEIQWKYYLKEEKIRHWYMHEIIRGKIRIYKMLLKDISKKK